MQIQLTTKSYRRISSLHHTPLNGSAWMAGLWRTRCRNDVSIYRSYLSRANTISGAYFYLGGLLLTLGGIGEWILGNTFPATVFTTFGKLENIDKGD